MKRILPFALSALSVLTVQAARFDIADIGKIARLSDPQISPDGKSIAVVVSRPNYELDVYQGEIVLIDIATKNMRVLTPQSQGSQLSTVVSVWRPA